MGFLKSPCAKIGFFEETAGIRYLAVFEKSCFA